LGANIFPLVADGRGHHEVGVGSLAGYFLRLGTLGSRSRQVGQARAQYRSALFGGVRRDR